MQLCVLVWFHWRFDSHMFQGLKSYLEGDDWGNIGSGLWWNNSSGDFCGCSAGKFNLLHFDRFFLYLLHHRLWPLHAYSNGQNGDLGMLIVWQYCPSDGVCFSAVGMHFCLHLGDFPHNFVFPSSCSWSLNGRRIPANQRSLKYEDTVD